MSAWPSPPCHKDCHCFCVHQHCHFWVKAGSCDTHTEETRSQCQWLRNFRPVSNLPFVLKILQRLVLQLQSDLCANCSLEIRQPAYRISQHWNCCFECAKRPPYKVWSETCVNTCAVGSECCFWHPWPCHPVKMTWEHFQNLGSSTVLVWVIPKWWDAVCYGWRFDVYTNTPCLWCSSGIGPWTCTIYPVLTTLSDVKSCHCCNYHKYADDRNLWRCTTLRFHFCSVQHLILYKRYFVMDAKQQTEA